jgi:hypothetical protein
MDRIRELQAQLKTLYQQETKNKLSERSVVTLILKLQQKNLLSIVYTNDGKEYLTLDQVEREIKQELQHHGGRISIVDLPTLLNVDITVIENAVNKLLPKHRNIIRLEGELLTISYFESVAKEINEWIQERSSALLSELSKNLFFQFSFLWRKLSILIWEQ